MAEGAPPADEVFNAARRLSDPDARRAYLDEACGSDDGLRARVEALLRVHEGAGSFLESPPGGTFAPAAAEPPLESAGSTIGPYRLLEQIGEGGFGVVFMAEQTQPVRRKVALKVLKPGMDTRQVIARFEAERQALALMDHPHIAKVLDAGATATGRPYFVMELVRGVPITEYCDSHHLTPRQRLELFVTVCHAVQHAHTKGVIHRDIKPTNVLVTLHDDRPVAKVIDFGIAKATSGQLTDKTLFTGFAQLIGTPLYMSPEQAAMSAIDVDTRSDVYSLGVLLYELLTGTTPFEESRLKEAAFDEIRRIIREEEPAKPSTRLSTSDALPTVSANRGTEPTKLTRLVRGELDWIVMKALEKDRTRRYETANGFAMDVQRYLADESVLACPASTVYRLRKFVRRNKGLVAAVAVVLLTLAGGIVGTGLGLVRAERAKERAEANFALANEAVETYLSTVTSDPDLTQAGTHGLRKKLLESAIPFFQRIAAQRSDDPAVERNRGGAHLRLAFVRYELGEHEAAVRDADAALAIFAPLGNRRGVMSANHSRARSLRSMEKHAEAHQAYRRAIAACDDSTVGSRFDLANLHDELGVLLNQLGEFEDAEAAHGRALKVWTELTDASPTVREYRLGRSKSLGAIANLKKHLGMHDAADAALRQSLDIAKQLVDEDPTGRKGREILAHLYQEWGNLLEDRKQDSEAETAYLDAVSIQRKLVADFPSLPALRSSLAMALYSLGHSYRLDSPKSEAPYLEAIGILERLAGDFPAVPDYRWRLASTQIFLAHVWMHQRKLPQAEALILEAMPTLEARVTEFPAVPEYRAELFGFYASLGDLLSLSDRALESLGWYEKAISQLEPMVAREPTNVNRRALYCGHLGKARALVKLERKGEALDSYQRVVTLSRIILGPDDPTTLGHMNNVATSYMALDRHEEARQLLHETLALMKAKIPDHPFRLNATLNLVNCLMHLGRAFLSKGDMDGAIARYEEAIRLTPNYATAHRNLGLTLLRKGEVHKAVASCKEAIRLDPDDAEAHHSLGDALGGNGDMDGAIASYREAIRLDPTLSRAHGNLGTLLCDAKRDFDGAIACYKEAIRLDPTNAVARGNLGNALAHKGELDRAIACYEEALGLDPTLADVHGSLGNVLAKKGDFDGAIARFEDAIRLGPSNAQRVHGNLTLVLAMKRTLLTLETRVPEVLAGHASSPDELIALADMCLKYKRRYVDATLLYDKAFRAEPNLVLGDPRYNAACAAALAAAGQGTGADVLDPAARTRLRGMAFDWLEAELVVYGGSPAADPQAGNPLQHWQRDADLSGVRDAEALAAMPDDERERWTKLWNDVRELLRTAK